MSLAQGDLALVHDPVTQRLLNSTGHEVVFGAYAASRPPPSVLPIPGRAESGEPGSTVPGYPDAHHRYLGDERARAAVAGTTAAGLRMVCIAVRPTWVGALDLRTRFPGAMSA
jgi:hypothetical protein